MIQSTKYRHDIQCTRRTGLPTTRPFKIALFVASIVFCLTAWASPPLALTLGIALALCSDNPFPKASKKVAAFLLKACVVLLGFGMNLLVVLHAGANGMVFAAGSIGLTLLLGTLLGRRLHIHPRTSALISAGTAISGGSAIAAVGSVVGAEEGEMTVAMGTVFVLNAVALSIFPPIGHALHLSQTQFGTWAGVAIHDISSVVGAASHYGLNALQTATAVKLSRALWIIPVAFGAAHAFRAPRIQSVGGTTIGFDPLQAGGSHANRLQIPWFIGLFLLASVARSLVPGVSNLAPLMAHLAVIGLTLTLFLIGTSLSKETLKAVGWKPLMQGILLWGFISGLSLLILLHVVA
jgi:uncharacterized integral membrane protein (TIGR00698 family)